MRKFGCCVRVNRLCKSRNLFPLQGNPCCQFVAAEAQQYLTAAFQGCIQVEAGQTAAGTVGYAVSDTDAAALAEKILLVAQRYEALSPACVAAAKRFNWETIAGEYAQMYSAMAERSRP